MIENMIIIGAGQAGLLAARRFAHYNPIVIEQQKSLPNNHGALLRFRSDEIAKSLGIEFKKITVYKGVLCADRTTITNSPTIRDFNAYSYKTIKRIAERSIINIHNAVRYIAPTSFITLLANRTNIKYDKPFQGFIEDRRTIKGPIISTIPMPSLMEALNYHHGPIFDYQPIWSINCLLKDTDVYQTLYVPYDLDHPYRVSITGDKMTLEFSSRPEIETPENFIEQYLQILHIHNECYDISIKKQDYGKIVPIDDNERQKFILWATDNYNIYSLGRYATWRQILLDDVLKDIAVIGKMISQRSGYSRHLPWKDE